MFANAKQRIVTRLMVGSLQFEVFVAKTQTAAEAIARNKPEKAR
jgi:hypothetical protein